mmetsp:Transcript_16386/g.33396  ORF Transcript_16386/g.33396 Transcript_16386/m.33396 type:complete len:137 (-) Transcript_16386:42-452(-)
MSMVARLRNMVDSIAEGEKSFMNASAPPKDNLKSLMWPSLRHSTAMYTNHDSPPSISLRMLLAAIQLASTTPLRNPIIRERASKPSRQTHHPKADMATSDLRPIYSHTLNKTDKIPCKASCKERRTGCIVSFNEEH